MWAVFCAGVIASRASGGGLLIVSTVGSWPPPFRAEPLAPLGGAALGGKK